MLFVIVYLRPEVVLHTIQTTEQLRSVIFFIFFYYEQKYFSTLFDSTLAFVPPRLTYIIPLMAITGILESAGGRQPALAKPPLYLSGSL